MFDYTELDKRYLRKEEFEARWEKQVEQNRTFWNSADMHLRMIEFQLQQFKILLDGFKELLEAGRTNVSRLEDKSEEHSDFIEALRLDMAGVVIAQDAYGKALYGDTTKPDAPESVLGMVRTRAAKADEQHKEIMGAVSGLNDRMEDVEAFIDFRRKVEVFISQKILKTTTSKIAAGIVTTFIVARISAPDFMDKLGPELIKFLTILLNPPAGP